MSFVHPVILIAAAGLTTAPILIHLLSHRRQRTEPWAAMEFLFAAHQRSKRRMRVEQLSLLVLRCLVLLILGVTLARPYFSAGSGADWLSTRRCDRVIVIDDSLSMRAVREDGRTAFDAAKAEALRLIKSAGERDGLAVLTASTQGRDWMPQPVRDRAALEGIVESLTCSTGMNDLPGGIRRAGTVLSRGSAAAGARIVYLLSDFTKSALESVSEVASLNVEGVDQLLVVDCGGTARGNVAIESFVVAGQMVGEGIPVRLVVSLRNHGAAAVDPIVEVRSGGTVLRRLSGVSIPPGRSAEQECEVSLDASAWQRLSAKLASNPGDRLSADDERFLTLNEGPTSPVLVVDESPEGGPGERHSFYYEAAVAAPREEEGRRRFRVTSINPGELSEQPLHRYAAVVLGSVARLAPEAWRRLGEYVRRGGGLLAFMGEDAVAENYNEQSDALLPVRLIGWENQGASEGVTRFVCDDALHPILSDLRGHERGGLLLARVQGRWKAEPGKAGESGRTLLTFSDRSPALVVSTIGRGRVAMLLSGGDMASTNLPSKPDFPPLMLNLTSFVCGGSASPPLICGDAIEWAVVPDRRGMTGEITLPDGHGLDLPPVADGEDLKLVYRETHQPGIYSMRLGDRTAEFAVNPSVHDGDLARADDGELLATMGSKARVTEPGAIAPAGAVTEPIGLLGVILVVMVGMESILAAWFGRAR